MTAPLPLIIPDWPAPPSVQACATTRQGGVSVGSFGSFNLGMHAGDAPHHVMENRRRLREVLRLSRDPFWPRQVHGITVVQAPFHGEPDADAVWTDRRDVCCAVLAADCLPVLLCDRGGEVVAAAHAGWRGLAAGVLENAVRSMPCPADRLMAWLGPAIGPASYEVGEDVRAAFTEHDRDAAHCFLAGVQPGKDYADLYELARRRLRRVGVKQVYGGGHCTLREAQRFFSYRRDGRCGRQAVLIWRRA